MRFEQFENEHGVAVAATDLLHETIRARREPRVVLPAGRTPLALFEEIVRRVRAGRLHLSTTRFFQLDEYVGAAPKDRFSFHALLRRHFLDPLGRKPGQDSLLDGAAKNPRAEIERHAARLAQLGGADLVLLGIGRNGHVAFNEPGSAPDARARVTPLAAETRQLAQAECGRSKAPTRGMTLGLHEIRSAWRIALLATGASKAAIVGALFEEPPSTQRPASLLLDHPRFTILADKAAAAAIRAHSGEPSAPPPTGFRERSRGAALRG